MTASWFATRARHYSDWRGWIGLICLTTFPVHAQQYLAAMEDEVAELVAKVSPSVVTVQSITYHIDSHNNTVSQLLVGSGLIVDSLGHVITSISVLAGSESIEVIDIDGVTHPATVVTQDRNSGLAILRATGVVYHPVKMGLRRQIRPGHFGIVVGNAYGARASAILTTIASARESDGFLQLSTPAIPGNSGAPVFCSDGSLLGIIAGQVGTPSGHPMLRRPSPAAVIPVDVIVGAVSLLPGSTVPPLGWLGVAVEMKLTGAGSVALEVVEVTQGSPAEIGGLAVGDQVTEMDQTPIHSVFDLRRLIRSAPPGSHILITLKRGGLPRAAKIVVGKMPRPRAVLPQATPSVHAGSDLAR